MTNLADLLPADAATIDATFRYCRSAAHELIAHATIELLRDRSELTNDAIARTISADQLESATFATINDNSDIDAELLHCLIELTLCTMLDCDSSTICADY